MQLTQGVLHAVESFLRGVAILAQVGQYQVLQPFVGNTAHKIAGLLVGQVAEMACYALYQVKRAAGVAQHFGVIVRLQVQGIYPLQHLLHAARDFARIGNIPQFFAVAFKEVAHGVRSIMVYGKGGHAYVPYLHGAAGFNVGVHGVFCNATQLLPHVARAIDVELFFFVQLPQPAHMVRVLMGEEQGIYLLDVQLTLLQTFANTQGADAGVYQQPGVATAYNGGITLAAAG